MKKTNLLIIVSGTLLVAACQSTPHQYNGVTGYKIENKTFKYKSLIEYL